MKIGILGGGQLGRMLALAGYPLGIGVRCYDPVSDSPARDVAELISGRYEDAGALARFLPGLDAVTYEFENVPAETVRLIEKTVPVYPAPRALEVGQDRLAEKEFFTALGIPTPRFQRVGSAGELEKAIGVTGLPAVLKTRRSGYDGKGQFRLLRREDATAAWQSMGGNPAILEEFVPFERELSVLAVRSRDGAAVCYPLIENVHRNGILSVSRAPYPDPLLQKTASEYAYRLMRELGYCGVFALELFHAGGRLLANEMAPRVHNSGHWSIEGADTSQFENHLRAVTGLPLGSTAAKGFSGMVNIIGDHPPVERILALPGVHLHLYGKSPRPLRKLGHVTVTAGDSAGRDRLLAAVRELLGA